jgi:hypothetical protein
MLLINLYDPVFYPFEIKKFRAWAQYARLRRQAFI